MSWYDPLSKAVNYVGSAIKKGVTAATRPDTWFSDGTVLDKYFEATKYVNPAFYAGKAREFLGTDTPESYALAAGLATGIGFWPTAADAAAVGAAAAPTVDASGNASVDVTKPAPKDLGKILPTIGAAASPAVDALSAYMSYQGMQNINQQSIQANKDIAAYNQENAIRNWQMQNAYADPSAAVRRYLAAGINPYAVMGNMPAVSGQIATPAASAPVLQSTTEGAAKYINKLVKDAISSANDSFGFGRNYFEYAMTDTQRKMAWKIGNATKAVEWSWLTESEDGREYLWTINETKGYVAKGQKDDAYRQSRIANAKAGEDMLHAELNTLVAQQQITESESTTLLEYTKKYYGQLLDSYFKAQIASNEYTATEVKKDVNSSVHHIISDIKNSDLPKTLKDVAIALVGVFAGRLQSGQLPLPHFHITNTGSSTTNIQNNNR